MASTTASLGQKPALTASPERQPSESLAASIEKEARISTGSVDEAVDLENQTPLPQPLHGSWLTWVRFQALSVYRRIFSVVLLCNTAVLVWFIVDCARRRVLVPQSSSLVLAAAINLAISTLARQEIVVNVLFFLVSAVPPTAPLWLRRRIAKVYCYGGMHSSCGIAAAMWYLASGVVLGCELASGSSSGQQTAVAVLTYFNVVVLVTTIVMAHPTLRAKWHNTFEKTHRFASWIALACLWAQILLQTSIQSHALSMSYGTSLVCQGQFWCLVVVSICLVYPWIRLRKRRVIPEVLSPHAIRLHFTHASPGFCAGIKLSTAPLTESHAFATIPNLAFVPRKTDSRVRRPARASGFSVVVSNAGDWTSQIINSPPTDIYTKGGFIYGVLRIAVLFEPMLVIATGSGIGPCLSLFQGRPQSKVRILWSTPRPLETFGVEIVAAVKRADPKAIIWDTREKGRPDLVALSWQICSRDKCEAAAIISNPKVTRTVVDALEARGFPAFGPIFDS